MGCHDPASDGGFHRVSALEDQHQGERATGASTAAPSNAPPVEAVRVLDSLSSDVKNSQPLFSLLTELPRSPGLTSLKLECAKTFNRDTRPDHETDGIRSTANLFRG